MAQSRSRSLKEAFANVAIGYGINFCANLIILPMVGLPVTVAQNLVIGLFFTFVSVSRTYIIRRWFTHRD